MDVFLHVIKMFRNLTLLFSHITHYMYSQFYGFRPEQNHTSHLALHSIPPPQQLPMTSVTTSSSPVSVRPAMVTEAAWTECRSHGQEGGA